ncbi:MAG: metal ABC transporter substrate-binding protein [Acidimicrobiaceae bacterium]
MKIKTVLALSIFIASCSGNDQGSSSQSVGCSLGDVVRDRSIKIATTVAPITSIVANIAGGSSAVITGIVPEGTNSHTFEPRPSDAATLESADVVFINGLVLEEPTKDLALANIRQGSSVCELGTEILPESEYIFDFSFPKEGGKPNPHLWTNPPMAKEYAQVVRDVLVRRDPSNASIYERNFSAFALKIDSLDEATKTATATIPEDQRKLLTYHDAYAYFAAHYGFTVVGAIQPSSFDEPTPKEIGELISQVKNQKVKAIFGSEVFPSTVLEQIGAETGVRYVDVLRDDDLLGEPGDQEHSWLGLMRFNFVTIVEALGGDASALKSLDVRDVVKDEAKYPQ